MLELFHKSRSQREAAQPPSRHEKLPLTAENHTHRLDYPRVVLDGPQSGLYSAKRLTHPGSSSLLDQVLKFMFDLFG